MSPSVEFLGHLVDAQGLRPLPEKIRAVQEAPTLTNVTELKAYLGLISYYGKFLPNLSTHPTSLWEWTAVQEDVFRKLLMSAKLLTHYNPRLPIILVCDASAYGIGAVLAHRMPDDSERPIAFSSRTLNPAECNYSQIEKRRAILYKKFYTYLFGQRFTIITDHKLLLSLITSRYSVY